MKIVSFSDHPAAYSGLARIHRDLALRIHEMPEFEIATLGYGAAGSHHLPFQQYHWKENDYFIPAELPFIAKDFCDNKPFIFFTIGDIQRFLPLADPQFCPDQSFAQWWKDQRQNRGVKLWGYFPIDAHDANKKLPPQLAHTLTHYDRILVPSEWARNIILNTLPELEVTFIPHGIDDSVFFPRDKQEAREKIGEVLDSVIQWPTQAIDVDPHALWIGIVATNQWRKDWGLGMEVVHELKNTRPVFLWCHTNRMKTDEWSILELLSNFNLLDSSLLTVGNVSDETMAIVYSAMDLTLAIGRGEGFSYSNFESLFSGTPCFAGSYGAHAEYMDSRYLVEPILERTEGHLCLRRPIFYPQGFVSTIRDREGHLHPPAPDCLKWTNVWPRFAEWFRRGL